MSLETYRKKRTFTDTKEPKGASLIRSTERHRYVVQEHHASHLHFDFRFELDGVLKSWAVPKGFPKAPGIRRLAIMTEDHPIEYLTFSGTIPEGNYGAGEMSIWDTGTYEWVASGTPENGLSKGKLELVLHGEKLQGQYDMIRTDDAKNEWLLIKTTPKEPASDATGANPDLATKAKTAPMPDPEHTNPMLAVTADAPFDSADFQFELKWDGYRAMAFVSNGKAEYYSRNHNKLTAKFPELTDLATSLKFREAVIDGEIVALDSNGRSNFQNLQNRMAFGRTKKSPSKGAHSDDDKSNVYIGFMAFDLLFADGADLTSLPLSARRTALHSNIIAGDRLLFSDHIVEKGIDLFRKAEEAGLEGIMAKRSVSSYLQGRSSAWQKIKIHHTTDTVIAGYTESNSEGRPFASLILGQYDQGRLICIGHVGTGFDIAGMDSLLNLMVPLKSAANPFEEKPNVNGVAHWLQPELVCEIKFANWTEDGRLRQPVFMQIRPDKPAGECTLEVHRLKIVGDRVSHEVNQREAAANGNRTKSSQYELLLPGSTVAESELLVDSHAVKVTHLNKLFWPQTGTTKRDLLRYYADVSSALLPHLKNRPLVIERFPDGAESPGFFQHDIKGKDRRRTNVPSFLETYDLVESGGLVHYALCNDLAVLEYLVNLGAIPLHCWNVTTAAPNSPDRIVWDLDPGGTFIDAVEAARVIKTVLGELGLTSWLKTSGANGLHVYVPIKAQYSSDTVSAFSELVAQLARAREPKLLTLERRINKRGAGNVYVDYVQNSVGKTVVAPYSVRAMPRPTVSAPLRWEELNDRLNIDDFTIESVPSRLASLGDLFEGVLAKRQSLESAIERLSTLVNSVPDSKKVVDELIQGIDSIKEKDQ